MLHSDETFRDFVFYYFYSLFCFLLLLLLFFFIMLSPIMVQTDKGSLDLHLEYLREHPSAALPPSPLSPNSYGRPRAPTPSASIVAAIDDYNEHSARPLTSFSPEESSSLATNRVSPLLRSVSESQVLSFARPPKSPMPLPDPNQFPDPYPFRPPHHHLASLPALSSAGSSSTRSSAYTSSGSALTSGDYGHVHVVSGEDDTHGAGITSDAVVRLLAKDVNSPSARGLQSRAPVDQTRWSESYSASSRSRSSSVGNSNPTPSQDNLPPKLQQKPSYDMAWTVDERDEVGMSEDETDDDHHLDAEDDEEKDEEERTSAIVIAEEGRGLIVHGDNVPISQLHVQPGRSTSFICNFRLTFCRNYSSSYRLFEHS